MTSLDASNRSAVVLSEETAFKYYNTNVSVGIRLFRDRIELTSKLARTQELHFEDIAGSSICKEALKQTSSPNKAYLTIYSYPKLKPFKKYYYFIY